jgi:hypothetical protein
MVDVGHAPQLCEADRMKEIPAARNKIVNVVLAYRPKPKSKGGRKRKRIKSENGKTKKSS